MLITQIPLNLLVCGAVIATDIAKKEGVHLSLVKEKKNSQVVMNNRQVPTSTIHA